MNEIAKDLLKIKAVFLSPNDPFTWASGIKSPIYCDNRLTLSYPDVRKRIASKISKIIKEKYANCEIVMGTATAGIPHATLAAYLLDLPTGYVRSGAKDHGRKNQIEGKFEIGNKVVLIEDLISTGGSSLEAVNALKEAGLDVLGVISIFTYGMEKAVDRFQKANVSYTSLVNLDELLDEAVLDGYLEEQDRSKLLSFRDNPSDESWMKK